MNSPHRTDADKLLATAKAGDAAALGELLQRYRNYMRLIAAAQLRSRLRVRASDSDVVQEAFLNAHRGFDQFGGTTTSEFVAWLKSILKRRIQYAYQHHLGTLARDARRDISLEVISQWVDQSSSRLENVLLANDPTPSTQLQKHERSVQVADALANLTPDHREVLMLRSIEGMRFAEVAEQMQRSEGAARMLWLRAIEALRDTLHEE